MPVNKMEESKLFEILNSYNRFWATGTIEAGIPREVLARCARELNGKRSYCSKGFAAAVSPPFWPR